MASSSLIISWLSLSPVYPCFLLEPRQATCSHGLHVQCWPLTRDCFLSFFFHAAFWVTSPGSASSSLILHTTASNFLLNLSTEFSISFIIFLFLEFFPYLPSHCWSSFVHLLLILSFILSRCVTQWTPFMSEKSRKNTDFTKEWRTFQLFLHFFLYLFIHLLSL